MKKPLFLISLAGILLLSGCASQQYLSKKEAFPGMYNENPVSIVVVPSINNSTAADAPNLYDSTINEPLSNSGFYVMPQEITNRFLRNEGLTDGGQIKNIAPEKFAEIFGCDSVLYTTINRWDTSYFIAAGNVAVGISYDLVSCKTGETLWQSDREIVIDTTSDADNIWIALALTAIQTATQDYVPIARKVNIEALNTIPYGKYHNYHGLDQEMPGMVESR